MQMDSNIKDLCPGGFGRLSLLMGIKLLFINKVNPQNIMTYNKLMDLYLSSDCAVVMFYKII
jgi:hypothetical protein